MVGCKKAIIIINLEKGDKYGQANKKSCKMLHINDDKVVVTKYKTGNSKQGYYDECKFKMNIKVDEEENILEVSYSLKEI